MVTFFVLTPTCNRAEHLDRAIQSVRSQSYGDWHHYILDDGSVDETTEILARYEDDPRIHSWRFDVNRGVNAARNFLLDRILERGEAGFIVILDDDDQLKKDALASFADAAEDQPSVRWFIANCHSSDGSRLTQIRGPYRPLCYVQDHKLGKQQSGDVAHAFHTSIVGDTRFIKEFRNAEEWWFYSGLAERSRMHALNFDAKTQDYLEGGLTMSQPNKGADVRIYALKLERMERLLDRSRRAALEAKLGRHLGAQGKTKQGFRLLFCALIRWPFGFRIYTYIVWLALVLPIRQYLLGSARENGRPSES